MLLERRSVKELEDILTERLELLRGGEIGPAHLHRAEEEGQVGLTSTARRLVDDLAPDHPSGPGLCGAARGVDLPNPGRPGGPDSEPPGAGSAVSSRRAPAAG